MSDDRADQRAARNYLAAIVESSDDAILSKSLHGIIQSCNAAAERMFGYTAEELVGKSVTMLIPPERLHEEEEILRRLRRGERIRHFETVRMTKDGRRIEISLTISPVRDDSGTIIGASKIARDITHQKHLAEAQGHLAALIEYSEDAILSKDLNGIIRSCNPAAERLFGYSAAELVGKPVRMLIPPERQTEEDEILDKMRRGEVIAHFETVRVTKHGTRRDLSLTISPMRDESGAIIGVSKIARDITDQKRLAADLAAQQEWFRVTLESIGDAVIATDVRGRVVFMNPVAEHLTGWRSNAAEGRLCVDIFSIINEETRRAVENPVSRVLAEGSVVGLANHTLLISADGTERPIDDSGAPIRNREGRIVGVVVVFRDVSERRRTESDRRAAAQERERLLEAERAARTEAERASRVKDDFVAMVSHELRTPLNAILGWTQLMMKGKTDSALLDRGLDVVARNTRVQAQLISDLLDISRIAAGKLRLEIQSVPLDAVIEDAIETVEPEAEAKGIRIRQSLEPTIGAIAGDPARLQQIVWNLLSNAIKFTPSGGEIRITLRRAGSEAEIVVTDTGVGIRDEFLPHVFDRFQQADRSITRRFGGLGLGLAIVKHLTELHGGKVRAASAGEGKGATFTVALPSSAVPTHVDTVAAREAPRDGSHAVALHGLRILVVEDESDTREFLVRLLETHGAQVVAAVSAADALERFSSAQPEMLVSDIGLPEVDGYDLMQRIREHEPPASGGLPAIALTAYARTEDRTRALRAGYQAHLTKPVEPNELIATIASFADLIEGRRKAR